jgi:hypothetical protein
MTDKTTRLTNADGATVSVSTEKAERLVKLGWGPADAAPAKKTVAKKAVVKKTSK